MEVEEKPEEKSASSAKPLIFFIIFICFLVGTYVMLFNLSWGGWGYMGYEGYSRPHSYWYFSGTHVYHSPSVKTGSIGGPGHAGGGTRGGK